MERIIYNLLRIFDMQILMSICVFLIFFIFRSLISQLILKIIFLLTKYKQKVKDTKVYKILNNFLIFFGLYLAIRLLNLSIEKLLILNKSFKIICIIFIAQTINSFINPTSKCLKYYVKKSKNDAMTKFFCKILRGVVWIAAGYIIIEELGCNLTGVVAGLGLSGVIISLAAQDTVKSLLSGIIILTDKPFDLGDYIEVGNYKGTVTDMTFRSIRIKANDNSIITIPNSTITAEYIVNWNKLKNRRLEFVLNLSMNTSSEKIKDIIEKIKFVLKNNPDILPDTVQVNLDEISSYSSDIKVFLYINETDYIKFLAVKEQIYCDILKLVEMENIELAYPTQTIYIKNDDDSSDDDCVKLKGSEIE